jgi:hypothetical protein
MYSAQFAFGLQEGLSKAEICAKPEMRSLPKGNMCRVWGGTPKYVTMLLALSMLLDLRLDCNGRGSDGSDGSDGTGVSPGVVSPLVLSSQAGGSGGEGLNLGSVLLKCAACSGQDEGEGLELEFLRECITAAGPIWNGIVLPYCKENASENSVALFKHQATYLGALIPSLLQKIRIVGPSGALQVVSGSRLIECFNKFFLNAPKGHFNNDNATDLLIILTSVANVDWTAHQSVEGADSEDCCVDKVLKACLEDDSFSDRASVLKIHSWQSLLGTLEGAPDGLNPGGVVQCSFSTELRSRRVRGSSHKRKLSKACVVEGRGKKPATPAANKSHQHSGDVGAPASETFTDEGGAASNAFDSNAAETGEAAAAQDPSQAANEGLPDDFDDYDDSAQRHQSQKQQKSVQAAAAQDASQATEGIGADSNNDDDLGHPHPPQPQVANEEELFIAHSLIC